MLGVKHTVALDESGATFVRDGLGAPSATNINGGTVTTDTVQGLDNTRWTPGIARAASNKWSLAASKAATQGQLSDVDFKVNENTQAIEKNTTDIGALQGQVDQGWTVSDGKSETADFNVKPGYTLKFNGDKNIDVTAADGAINVGLKPVVTLGGDTEDSNKVVLDGENGTINAVNITKDGYGHGSPTITNTFSFDKNGVNLTNTKETGGDKGAGKTTTNTFNFDENGATFTETVERKKPGKIDSTVTRINGGTITTDTVKGLNNTEWKANSVVENRAATEGQLKDVYTEATKHTTVELADGEENLTLNGEDTDNGKVYTLGLNGDLNVTSITTGNTKLDSNGLTITGTNGNTTLANDGLTIAGTKYVSSTGLNAGDKVISGVKAGVSGTDAVNVSQLKAVEATANKGWTAKASDGGEITVKPGKTLNFNGDGNIDVTATSMWGNNAINIGLKPVVTLDGDKFDNNKVVLDGNNGTVNATNSNREVKTEFVWEKGHILPTVTKTTTTTSNEFNFDENGGKFVTTEDQIKVSTDISDSSITKVTHTAEFNENGATFTKEEGIWPNKEISSTNIDGGTVTTDTVKGLSNTTWDAQNPNAYATSDKAATEAQLQKAAAASKTTVSAGDNIKVDSTQNNDGHIDYKVSLKDNITLDGTAGHINFNPDNGNNMISIKDTTGDTVFNVANNGTVSSDGDVIADADGEKYSLTKLGKYAVKYDETAFDNDTPTITLASGSDNKGTRIRNVADGLETKDAVNLGQLQSTEKHIATNKGNDPESNNLYAVDKDGNITLTEVDGAGNKTGNQIVLSDIASKSALDEVQKTANAGWTAQAGKDTVSVKPNETLTFVGDENLTVSADAADKKIKVGLNDDITLGNPVVNNPEGERSFTINTTDPEGYVPKSYIDDQGRVDDFVSTHGGFMMYATDTSGHGVFGVTTDGMVHAKDVISYMPNPDNNSDDKILKYSLNDIGDIVTQIAHGQYDKTGMEYTLISDFSSVEDKDKPFQAEDGNRTIGLAVRQDGAVVVGAIVDEEGKLAESGIRINDDTNAGGGKDTITGLSNTTWTPPTNNSMARTNGDTRIDSMAATLGQLDDLYDSVVGYNVDENGSVNPNHVTLKGEEKYTFTTDANGTKTYSGGVKLDNVAYAVTDTASTEYNGSAAVNVDLLKDTIAGVKAETNTDVGDRNYEGVTSKDPITNEDNVTEAIGKLDNRVGDLNYNSVNGTKIDNGDDVTTAIGKLDNRIDSIGGTATSADNDTITGGKIDAEKGTISLTQKDKGTITLEGQFTNSVVDSAELKDGTLTITSKDQYSGDTSSVKVEGLASTEVVGAKNKEDLATAYKDADKDGNATTEYITDSETMVDADIALDHAVQDLASNDQYLNSRIDSVEKRLGDVEQRIDKVGAMAAAIANLRTMGFDPEAPTEIAVGVGQYKSETGLAIGVFHYPNQDFMLSASLSTSGDEVMGGIGATWRIGRKTAAEKAKDEEKRILAKAEEIKQAAKRAEVKAQADRHAKLLAEREAKGESIRPIENKVEQTQEQA